MWLVVVFAPSAEIELRIMFGAFGGSLGRTLPLGFHDGTLSITPAALTITANNATNIYGQTLTFAGTEFTTSGLVNGDTVTNVTLSSAGAAATAAVSSSPYPIVASAALGTMMTMSRSRTCTPTVV